MIVWLVTQQQFPWANTTKRCKTRLNKELTAEQATDDTEARLERGCE